MQRTVILLMFSALTCFCRAQQTTFSNNLLYDTWLTPNLRVGERLGTHWSVGLTAGYRPWPTSDETTRKWRHLLLSPELRYWSDSVNVHSFYGVNLIYSHYNVANVKFPFGLYPSVRHERRQGDLAALGIFYGYSWPMGRFWNLEAAVGMALGYTKYKRYECAHCGTQLGKGSGLVAIPQAALNLVFNIPGRPRPMKDEEVGEQQFTPESVLSVPTVTVEPFVPVLKAVPDFAGRAGQLQRDNPVLHHISEYRPYDRTQILRRDKAALYVHFTLASSVLHPEFRENASVLSRILDITRQIMADSTSSVKTIQIVGLASIEGSVAGNEKLGRDRAMALQRYIQQQLMVPDSLFDTVGGGEAWTEFRDQLVELIEKGNDITGGITPEAIQTALDITDNEPDANRCEQRLRQLDDGRTWAYLKEHILADQRNSGYIRIYYDYVPDTAAATINEASELLRTDCSECHHKALALLQQVASDERAQNALGVALYLCGRKQDALPHLRRAAAQGNAEAQENLERLKDYK